MAPLVIPEKYLTKQTKDNKEEILKLIKERILQNKKTNPKNLREGLPKPFLYGDEIVQIKNVSAFARGEKNVQVGRITEAKKVREALLRAMTDETGAAAKTAYGRGARKLFKNQEDHHIIFRNLLDNFYENLDPDDAAELTAHLARRGSPAGNVIENLQGIDIDLHDSKMPGSLHQWARNMGIDSKSFPDLTNLDLDARTAAIDDWLDLIEEPLLDRTAATLSRQDYRRWGTDGLPKPTKGFKDRPNAISKEAWKEYLTNQRENVKARANLLDKYPILAEDLDSPNIRPELKARYEKALSLVPEDELKTFKALTSEQDKHALAWLNDRDYRKTIGKPIAETTELGRPLGGIGNKITTNINPKRVLTSTYRAVKPIAKPFARYVLPAAGLYFAGSNQKTIAAEYEKNPTKLNRARTLFANAQVGLEMADTFTLGASGAVTWIPNLIGDAAEYTLRTIQNPQTKEESELEIKKQVGTNFSTL